MHVLRNLTAVALLICTASPNADEAPGLNVEFDIPVANISPRSSERPINLPSITYAVRATASCPELQSPESISISIADTRISIRPVDGESIETTIRVSNKQLGPVTANDFCLTEPDSVEAQSSASESIKIDNALSAQMSLRCVGENDESISYKAAVLGVALQCTLPEPDEDSPSIAQ